MTDGKPNEDRPEGWRPTRRAVLARAGGLALTATAAGPLLAACGGGGSSTTGGNTAPSTGGGGGGGGGGAASAYIEKMKQLLPELPQGANAGAGTTVDVGAVLPLTGPGTTYGVSAKLGMEVAAKHIEEAGGPSFKLHFYDHKSGDSQAAISAARDIGIAGYPLCLTSYQAVNGSMLPSVEQYKFLTFDPSGGASPPLQGKPYFYASRADPNSDPTPGILTYANKKLQVKSVGNVSWENGEAVPADQKVIEEWASKFGMTSNPVQTSPYGNTDFTSIISTLKQQEPDIVLSHINGPEGGLIIKEAAQSGLNVPFVDSDFEEAALKAAGSTGLKQFLFAFDFFNAEEPGNEWAKLFVEQFKEETGKTPENYNANFYESMFLLWSLAAGVAEAGGDTGSGEAYLEALEKKNKFYSLHGSTGAAGEMVIDLESHSPSKRAMGIYQAGEKPKVLATFNIDAAEFKLA